MLLGLHWVISRNHSMESLLEGKELVKQIKTETSAVCWWTLNSTKIVGLFSIILWVSQFHSTFLSLQLCLVVYLLHSHILFQKKVIPLTKIHMNRI